MDILFVYVTFESAQQARDISGKIVKARLAACANIFPAHESLYWWDGEVQSASETAVIFKTTQNRFTDLKAEIIKLHSYDCPCIVALPVKEGHTPFLEWIKDNTQA